MVDLTKLSDSDLKLVASGNVKMMSTAGLNILSGTPATTTSSLDRFGQGMKDPIDAGAQLVTHILPNSVVNAGNKLNNFIADKTGLVAPIPQGGVDQMINDQKANYHAPEGMDWARLSGNILSPANLAIASKLPVAASLLGRVGVGAGGGAVMNTVSAPVVGKDQKDYWTTKAEQAGLGAIGGGSTPLVTGALSRVISSNASKNLQNKLLNDEGILPTIGQALGGAWNKTEEKLQSVPILGDMITRARGQANQQFEAAAHNRALAPIGQSIPSNISGRDSIVYTENALKDAYDTVLNKIGAIKPDTTFTNNLTSLTDGVNKLLIPKTIKNNFNQALADVQASITQNGYMTSESYKMLESTLGQDAKTLGLGNVAETKVGTAVKQLQLELRDMLNRQAGSSADELKAVNTGWANFKRVQNAAGKIGADTGEFTPAQLQNSIRALDGSKDKAAFARGSALMQDLGDAGKTILSGKVADSGTAGRWMLGAGAAASGAMSPAIPLGLLGGSALYTKPAQQLLNALVTKRPQFAAPLAQKLRDSANYMLPASSAIGLGLLND